LKLHLIQQKCPQSSSSNCWGSLQVGQVIKVKQNERFPADLILLKSSNSNGVAYVETLKLDGETNLKHRSAIRDMQDAMLSEADASTINGHIYCDHPNEFLYSFDALMTIKVKNSQDSYKYSLDYNQLLLRGTSLKSTQWIYGIVVYTGQETKIK
jgi:magnesium-transporting ATPase (P-type)